MIFNYQKEKGMERSTAENLKAFPPVKSIVSEKITDRRWDLFVHSNPSGFHEQTAAWAASKSLEGWKPIRVIFEQDQRIRGGFQILMKKKRFAGAVGFLNKGPLIDSDDPSLKEMILTALKETGSDYNINLLVISPPGGSHADLFRFDENDFSINKIFSIIDSTLEIDLRKSSDSLLKDLRKTLRKNVRHLEALRFRRGKPEDLGLFYDLMLETCRRQGVSPNPSSLEIFKTIWNNFFPDDMIRLYFIEKCNEIIAGIVMLLIRDRFIVWKIGWNGKYPKSNPNAALVWYSIMLAKEEGFKVFDFASVDLKTAEQIRNQKKLPQEVVSTPTFFKLGFGGELVTLPCSYIYFPNSLLKSAYKVYCALLPIIPILPRSGKNDKRVVTVQKK